MSGRDAVEHYRAFLLALGLPESGVDEAAARVVDKFLKLIHQGLESCSITDGIREAVTRGDQRQRTDAVRDAPELRCAFV